MEMMMKMTKTRMGTRKGSLSWICFCGVAKSNFSCLYRYYHIEKDYTKRRKEKRNEGRSRY